MANRAVLEYLFIFKLFKHFLFYLVSSDDSCAVLSLDSIEQIWSLLLRFGLNYIPFFEVFLSFFDLSDLSVTKLLVKLVVLSHVDLPFIKDNIKVHLLSATMNNWSFLDVPS